MKSKSSSGYDYISAVLMKKLSHILSTPLSILCNKCLHEGKFPDLLKIGKVIPLHKGNDTTLINNYRPITLLPALSKILEKLLTKRINKFLQLHNLLDIKQYGFRPKHSTIDAVTQFIGHTLEGIEHNKSTLTIFLDFSKAFDTIDHSILLKKLPAYGIRGPAFDIIKSYLENRKQFCELSNTKSAN